jgi:metallo-beta-lactamase family protein
MSGSPTLRFLGAARTVTGSRFLLETPRARVLFDCGLFQGLKELRLRNWDPFPVPPEQVDAVVLTHAHLDHSGYLPALVRAGFRGPVFCTPNTAALAAIVLPDSGQLQEEDAAYANRRGFSKHTPALPLYTEADAHVALRQFRPAAFGAPIEVAPGVRATLRRAGHILGSAWVRVDVEGHPDDALLFSGDLGRPQHEILLPPEAPDGVATVVVESTYGDRRHDPDSIADQLERAVRAAVDRGGAVVVPAFAVGRSQELLYHLSALARAGRIPKLPTYLDSPMAIDATAIYWTHPEEFDEAMRRRVFLDDSPFQYGELRLTRTPADSRAINEVTGPVLIIAASGMATGGRILHHLRQRLPDPKTTVLLVGYQVEGTRGRLLQDGARSVRIFGEEVPVRARVDTIHGLSAHADADGLVAWLRTATRPPKRLAVVHGEAKPAAALAERVRRELGWEVVVPVYRDRLPLE